MAKRGRKPRSAIIEADEPQKDNISVSNEPESNDVQEALPAVVVSDLPAESLFSESPLPATAPDDIPSPDEGLTPAQKLEFVRLVRQEMTLSERAKRLANLARMHGNKTAAVGLRAIQFMAQLEGWTDSTVQDAPPMFTLPEGAQVAVAVKVPSK